MKIIVIPSAFQISPIGEKRKILPTIKIIIQLREVVRGEKQVRT